MLSKERLKRKRNAASRQRNYEAACDVVKEMSVADERGGRDS